MVWSVELYVCPVYNMFCEFFNLSFACDGLFVFLVAGFKSASCSSHIFQWTIVIFQLVYTALVVYICYLVLKFCICDL
jgi:hypothetical protein